MKHEDPSPPPSPRVRGEEVRLLALAVMLCALLAPQAVRAADPREIDSAIAMGKKYLYSRFESGNWDRDPDKYEEMLTGQTALAVRALMSAGESYQEPRIAEAIAFIRKTPTTGVFALGMRCQLWSKLPPTPENRQAMAKDARALINGIDRKDKGKGLYPRVLAGKDRNTRSSYYAILGLWAAEQYGYEVDTPYWQLVEKSWLEEQDGSGGWGYYGKGKAGDAVTPGTTANGIATLFITQDFLHADEGIALRGNIKNPRLDKSVTWLVDNYDKIAKDDKFKFDYPYQTLYAIRQVGAASGLKYFKSIDWYDVGADKLVRQQKNDGSWSGDWTDAKVTGTSFAILFLTAGRAPVVMNKLQYTIGDGAQAADGNWNQRPRDVANLTRWIGKQAERELNWQIVNLKAAPLSDLHEAPILYVSGNQELKFGKEDTEKLRQFVEGGGMILGNADGNAGTFTSSFKELGKGLFPEYEFRQLSANHTIFTNEQFPAESWKKKPAVLGLSNGARELMLIVPDTDLSRAWQLREFTSKSEIFQFSADLFQYSVDKRDARNRGETYQVTPDPRITPTRSLTVARIKYPGTWNPEPGGWRRMTAILNNRDRVGIKTIVVDPASDALTTSVARLAHLTGLGKFKLSDDARSKLKAFVASGGTLFVDAAGGNAEFAQAAEQELAATFGADVAAQLKEPLPESHPIYNVAGRKMEDVGYRMFARQLQPGELKGPRLRGIEIGGRLVVIFSPEDLSVGMVGQPVDGINGYDPKSATTIVRNILLHVASTGATPAPATKSSTKPPK